MTHNGITPGHDLLYTLTLANGRKVGVYGDAATWRTSAAKLLLDAGKLTRQPVGSAHPVKHAAPVIAQE